MTPARFHLDESVDGRVAKLLRQRDRDCTTSGEVGLLGSTDQQQIAFAREAGRVLVTCDEDFAAMHCRGVEHAGIVYWNSDRHFGVIFREIDEMASERGAEGFAGQIVYL